VNLNVLKIAAFLCTISALLFLAPNAESRTSLNGDAEVSYTNYNAEADGQEVFSGDSLVQKYSILWSATNLIYRNQPQYYKISTGYDWKSFNTNITDAGVSSEIKDSYGKFRYNGAVGYSPVDIPIRFTAYLHDDYTPRLKTDVYQGLLSDGLARYLEGRTKTIASGFSFVFEPERARTANMYNLPRLHLDYRELRQKGLDKFSRTDNVTKELAVAGLNKENNWLHYRNLRYEDNYNINNNYERQQIQLGLIDYAGRRKWSPLTNWITVSADGQLTTFEAEDKNSSSDEYDLNFQAIASRKTWEARTFMNYNRLMAQRRIDDQVRVPLYIKGIWGADTDWHLNLTANRGREKMFVGQTEDSYTNLISVGARMFRREAFTLSPSLTLSTSKAVAGKDAYEIMAGVETASTTRYSNKLYILGGYQWRTKDDGYDTGDSKSWSQHAYFRGNYRPNRSFVFELKEDFDIGDGTGYITSTRVNYLTGPPKGYTRTMTTASVGYVGSAALSGYIDATYDLIMTDGLPDDQLFRSSSKLLYTKNDLSYRLDAGYERRDNGMGAVSTFLTGYGDLQYRPDRYNDTLVRIRVDKHDEGNIDRTTLELLQKYTRNIFTKSGVIRNLARLEQEFSFKRESYNIGSVDTKYLLLSGRYSPTARLSLYGAVKYQSDPGAIVMTYNAGLAADFKLLTTSLDYTLATRDSDDRMERRFSATVRRTF